MMVDQMMVDLMMMVTGIAVMGGEQPVFRKVFERGFPPVHSTAYRIIVVPVGPFPQFLGLSKGRVEGSALGPVVESIVVVEGVVATQHRSAIGMVC